MTGHKNALAAATTEFGEIIVSRMTREVIENLVDAYDEILSANKMELIKRFLIYKIEILKQISERRDHG